MKSYIKRQLQGTRKAWVYQCARGGYALSRELRRFLSTRNPQQCGTLVPKSRGFKHDFCGYYDHSPFCPADESLILLHSTDASIRKSPDPNVAVTVRVVNWRTGKEVERLGTSHAWNWQQGSRALWFDGTRWIYNSFNTESGEYTSILGVLGSEERTELPWPVQEISPLGYMYSINYPALAAIRRDYGYFNRAPRKSDFDTNGIREINTKTGQAKVLVHVQTLVSKTKTRRSEQISVYKVNHVLCSPSGDALIFMFRYFTSRGRRVTDVYSYRRTTGSLQLILADKSVSHYCWLDDARLLYTGKRAERYGYHIIDIENDSGQTVLESTDGHPVAVTDTEFLFDTYPDSMGVRSLWRVQLDAESVVAGPHRYGQFVEPWYLWGERRCDLHPSVSASGCKWQVDTVEKGNRCVRIGEL